MKRICIFLLSITMLITGAITAYAQDTKLELYNMSIKEDINENAETLAYIEDEILNQVRAIMEINRIDSIKAIDVINLDEAVKVVFVGSGDDMIEQIGSARDVAVRKAYVSTENTFDSRFLDYFWKIPVLSHDSGYLFATVIINSLDDIVVSCTMVPNKELNDVTYLFDNELIPNILRASDLNVDYDTVLPVSLPVISTDIVIFIADKVQYAIPFSARPDLLGVENGEIYEYEKLESIIDSLLIEMSSGNTNPNSPVGGGPAQAVNNSETLSDGAASSYGLYFGIVVAIVCAGTFILIIYKKKQVRG